MLLPMVPSPLHLLSLRALTRAEKSVRGLPESNPRASTKVSITGAILQLVPLRNQS